MNSQLKYVFWNPYGGSWSFHRDIIGRYSHTRTVTSQVIWRWNVTQKHYSALLLRGSRFYTEDWSSSQKINHIARWVFQTMWVIILLCYKYCKSVHICRLWCQGGAGEMNKQIYLYWCRLRNLISKIHSLFLIGQAKSDLSVWS